MEDLHRPHMHLVDGRMILDSPVLLGHDLIHPSPSGMQVMATRLAEVIRDRLDRGTQSR